MVKKTGNKPVILKDIEKDYKELKKKFNSDSCYFESYGYRPAMEFAYAYYLFKDSFSYLKKHLKKMEKGKTLKDFHDTGECDCLLDPAGFLWGYDGFGSEKYSILPKRYEDRYDYEFLCRMERAFNAYAKRMFAKEDPYDHLAITPMEEIIGRGIFMVIGAELEDIIHDYGFKWKEEDLSEIPLTEEDLDALSEEEKEIFPIRYEEDWLYEHYYQDADVDMVLFSGMYFTEELRRECGIGDYSFEKWFDKQFWGSDVPVKKNTKAV